MQIYNFDMELRSSLMYLLESIEVSVRTHIGYYHGKAFGALGYYDKNTFENEDRFKNLTPEIRKQICKNHYGVIGDKYISNWLQGCTILRNICAHRGRLFNRPIPFSLKLGKGDKQFFNKNNISVNKASAQLFAYLIVMKKMVPYKDVWSNFYNRLLELEQKYSFVRLDYYGFTKNWRNVLL